MGSITTGRRFIAGKKSVLLFHRQWRDGKGDQHIALSFTGSSMEVECLGPNLDSFSSSARLAWVRCSVAAVGAPMKYGGWDQRARRLRATRWEEGYSPWEDRGDVEDLKYPLGTYARAVMYENERNPGKAALLYEKVLKEYEQRLDPSSPELLWCLNHLARNLQHVDRDKEAKQCYIRALQAWEARGGIERGLIRTLNDLAVLLWKEKDYEESRKYFGKAMVLAEQLFGPASKEMFAYTGGLIFWYEDEEAALVDAEALRLRDIAVLRSMLSKDAAGYIFGLGELYYLWGRHEQADAFYHYALDLMRKSKDPALPRHLDWYQRRQEMLEGRVRRIKQKMESR